MGKLDCILTALRKIDFNSILVEGLHELVYRAITSLDDDRGVEPQGSSRDLMDYFYEFVGEMSDLDEDADIQDVIADLVGGLSPGEQETLAHEFADYLEEKYQDA